MAAYKVLIVEDEAPLRTLYESLLGSYAGSGVDFDVISAASAEEASEVLADDYFHVVMTDYRMPGRNGVDLIEEVLSRSPRTQCLLISGFVDAGLVRSALEAGARSCLKKPCSVHELIAAVTEAAKEGAKTCESANHEVKLEPGQTDRQLASRIQEVLEANFLMTVFIDPAYNIRFANSAFSGEYGDCIEQKCYEVIVGGSSPCSGCQAVAAVDAKAEKTVLRNGRSPAGEIWEIEEKLEPWLDKKERLMGLILSFSPVISPKSQKTDAVEDLRGEDQK